MILRLLVFLYSSHLFALEGFEFLGEFNFEQRYFDDDNNAATIDKGSTFSVIGEMTYENGDHYTKFRGFARTDLEDSSRDWTNIEDFYYSYTWRNFSVRAGMITINWTATEAFHPADIINSRQLDGNVEYFPKIGEPMLELKYLLSDGALTFYFMPRYMSPDFPGASNRLGGGTDLEAPEWRDRDGVSADNYGAQYAVRFNWSLDFLDGSDMSFHVVNHMDRDDPIIELTGPTTFTPVYFEKVQYGGTVQAVWEKWLLKLEAAFKDFVEPSSVTTIYGTDRPEDYSMVALGVEYPFSVFSGMDLTLIGEWQKVFGLAETVATRRQAFQNDYLLGARLAFNDIDSKEIFGYFIGDLNRQAEYLINLKYSQRLTEKLKVNIGGRYIDAPPRDTVTILGLGTFDDPKGVEVYHEDHQVYVDFNYFF